MRISADNELMHDIQMNGETSGFIQIYDSTIA